MAHVLYILCVYVCIVSSYICITFMNIITFDYFVFTQKMLEIVVKRSEFVYIREQHYTKVIYYYDDDMDDHSDGWFKAHTS